MSGSLDHNEQDGKNKHTLNFEEEDGKGGEVEFEYDLDQKNWVPRTVDVRGTNALNQNQKNLEGTPYELLQSDTNIVAMRVPNFSYREEHTFKGLGGHH